jgi:hypothetical protein
MPGTIASVGVDFKARDVRKAEILARYRVVLMTDIANFFHTIYSPSLPWAVLGKQHVKDVLEPPIEKADKAALDQHWSSQIDNAIQRGNSRETFGIPVGPDTSRMIAEILLSGIHSNQSFETILQDRAGYRLVDDFFIGFDDEVEAYRCKDILRRALWDYNLHFNETRRALSGPAHSSTTVGNMKSIASTFQRGTSRSSGTRSNGLWRSRLSIARPGMSPPRLAFSARS